jgi:hypothetical protein
MTKVLSNFFYMMESKFSYSIIVGFTPQDFVTKWKRVTSRERQATQEHFIDLCRLVGHETPNEFDPTGTRFAFEMGAGKTSGG